MSAITDHCSQCLRHFPQYAVENAAVSFLASFTATTILSGGNIILGAGAGAFAVTASFIHSAILCGLWQINQQPIEDTPLFLLNIAVLSCVNVFLGPVFGITLSALNTILFSILPTLLERPSKPRNASGFLILA